MYVGLRIVTSGHIAFTSYSPIHLVRSRILEEFGSAPAALTYTNLFTFEEFLTAFAMAIGTLILASSKSFSFL